MSKEEYKYNTQEKIIQTEKTPEVERMNLLPKTFPWVDQKLLMNVAFFPCKDKSGNEYLIANLVGTQNKLSEIANKVRKEDVPIANEMFYRLCFRLGNGESSGSRNFPKAFSDRSIFYEDSKGGDALRVFAIRLPDTNSGKIVIVKVAVCRKKDELEVFKIIRGIGEGEGRKRAK